MVVDNTVQWLQLNLKETGLPVGFEYFTMNPNIPAGSLPLQGGLYSRLAYPDLWEWVQKQAGYLLEESAWQAKAADNGGNVPFYSKGDGTTTFRVPSLKCWVKGAGSISEVGGYLAAGLPNIEGQLGLWDTEKRYSTTSGAFSTNNGALEYGQGHALGDGLIADFNASLSNPIYGSSDTVQPPSIVGMWLVKAYGTVTNVGSTDVANISTGLAQAETRISALENHGAGATVVESYRNGTEWYRVWSDGWVEQGGKLAASNVFLKPFADATYRIVLGQSGSSASANVGRSTWVAKSATSFTANVETPTDWYACGQGA